jgi:hypothetical protein
MEPQVPSLYGPRENNEEKVIYFTTCDAFKVLGDLMQPSESIQVAHELVSLFNVVII